MSETTETAEISDRTQPTETGPLSARERTVLDRITAESVVALTRALVDVPSVNPGGTEAGTHTICTPVTRTGN